jgi:fatty-acyl-CoA synthase
MPGVFNAVVVGVPDEKYGEEMLVQIILKEDYKDKFKI